MVLMNVPVPAGQQPGATISVVTPSGQTKLVTIPPGATAGSTFQLDIEDSVPQVAQAVPVPAQVVTPGVVTGQVVTGQALAPMETQAASRQIGGSAPPLSLPGKKAKDALNCTSAATMVFSILLIGSMGGILGLATSSTVSCCVTGHVSLAKKAKEVRALAISALVFTLIGALSCLGLGGALIADSAACAAASPYDLGNCGQYTNAKASPQDIPYEGPKGEGYDGTRLGHRTHTHSSPALLTRHSSLSTGTSRR